MKRRHWVAGVVAVAAGATGAGLSLRARRDEKPAADDAFWSRRFDQPGGGELALASLKGQPLLLNFWATWCPPCVKEMPMLDAFQKTGRLKVVGLAIDGPTPVREFLGRLPVGFPIGLAGLEGADLARSLGNSSGGLPFSVLFDREGRLHERKLGALSPDDLQRWAAALAPA